MNRCKLRRVKLISGLMSDRLASLVYGKTCHHTLPFTGAHPDCRPNPPYITSADIAAANWIMTPSCVVFLSPYFYWTKCERLAENNECARNRFGLFIHLSLSVGCMLIYLSAACNLARFPARLPIIARLSYSSTPDVRLYTQC